MANTAREFAAEEKARGDDSVVTNDLAAISHGVDEVCIHGAWLPLLWKAAKRAKTVGAKLVIRPAGSYDPVRLAYHGWKKKLVAPFEHRMLRRADVALATCEAEAEWIREYEPRVKKVEITDLKRFFDLNHVAAFAEAIAGNGERGMGNGEWRAASRSLSWAQASLEGRGISRSCRQADRKKLCVLCAPASLR